MEKYLPSQIVKWKKQNARQFWRAFKTFRLAISIFVWFVNFKLFSFTLLKVPIKFFQYFSDTRSILRKQQTSQRIFQAPRLYYLKTCKKTLKFETCLKHFNPGSEIYNRFIWKDWRHTRCNTLKATKSEKLLSKASLVWATTNRKTIAKFQLFLHQ